MKPSNLRALAALVLLAGCVDEYVDVETGLSSFAVELVDTSAGGSADEPVPAPREITRVRIRAQAYGTDGQPFAWNGTARVKVTPGITVPSRFPIEFKDGVGEADVAILAVHSETRLWVIDDTAGAASHAVGVTPAIQFDEPTLADINSIPPQGDNTTSFYVKGGVRGDFVRMERDGFAFADRASTDDACTLADPGATKRDLIVTATTATGFYVTDLAEPAHPTLPGNFGHIFVFNFNFPEGLEVGDRLHALEGTIQEFSGNTQITFPTYRVSYCPLVEGDDFASVEQAQRDLELAKLAEVEAAAPVIDTRLCTGGSGSGISLQSCGYSSANFHMESLESALVQIPEVKLPEMWVRCDFDGDGQASSFVQSGNVFGCLEANDAECACNVACQTSAQFPSPDSPFEASHADKAFDARGKLCAELTGYESFGQYIVQIVENGVPGPRINLTSRDAFPEFDPELEENLGAHVRVRGNLQHVRAARPRWVVQARVPDERNATDVCCLPAGFCPAGLQPCSN